jgi:hypothetical protein
VATTAPIFAQGVQTGTLKGNVTMPDGTAVPGVLVTASSPAMQGSRDTVTGETGAWIIRNLVPGLYNISFELEGMTPVAHQAAVTLGGSTHINAEMAAQVEGEQIEVRSTLPSALADSQVSTNYTADEVNNLPIGRTPAQIATLAPGLTSNTPNGGQVTISGGFAYDNVFLIDGVDANDNLYGTSNPVYIEDAIADLQVLTSGISAEYGRFTGGVVNVITKSGGNEFSGSLRVALDDDDWREQTPVEKQNDTEVTGPTNKDYAGTLGGYILKDKLWFFVAARDEESSDQGTFSTTGIAKTSSTVEDRQEYKGTFNIKDKHQLQFVQTDREQTSVDSSFSFSATPDTLRTRTDPNELQVARYSGVLTPSLFAELQVSEKIFTFMNTHGNGASNVPGTQSFIENSPFFDFFGNFGDHYNAPYFDGSDPEDRANEQTAASISYFADSASAGSHDLKLGFEDYTSFRTGGNSQTPTDWVMSADVVTDASGAPVLTANNKVTPIWEPFGSGAWLWLANRDAKVDIQTQSLFVNDRWQLNDKWSFNIGFRYEEVSGESDSGIVTADTDAFVPRLGASYDVRGDGKYRIDATYASYAGKYSESQFASNTDVGNPPGLLYFFVGEPGEGYDYAPAYDFDNQLGDNYIIAAVCDGTQNVFVDPDLSSPTVDEITLSGGMELKRGGFLKMVYTTREYNDFVEDFVDQSTGTTEVITQGVPAGTFSNTVYRNSDFSTRDYEAIQLLGRYRLSDNWTLDGNWTYQIKNEGNFEGEATNQPGVSSDFGDYPEIRSTAQHYPVGTLNDFAENKIRVWTNYNLGLGRAGNLNLGLLMNHDSGRTWSATDTVGRTATQTAICNSIGYVDCFTTQDLFFGQRGGVKFSDATTFDFTANYQLPIFKDFDLWIKLDMFNLLDDDTQTSGETDVTANFDGPLDALGLPTTFTPDADFRDGTANADYSAPREYRFYVGFRF